MRENPKAESTWGMSWKREGARQDNGSSGSCLQGNESNLFPSSDQDTVSSRTVLRTMVLSHFQTG